MTAVEQRQRSDDVLEARRIMKFMTLGLGALWTIDGLLQLQPQMFTQNFAAQVIGMGLMALPPALYFASLKLLVWFLIPNIVLWNFSFAALQLAIGFSLLLGSAWIRRLALMASVAWGVMVWVIGEDMASVLSPTTAGGVFPGTPSILSGFPGAALVYVVIALFLLLIPVNRWMPSGRFSIVRDAPALLFLLSAAVQAAPIMWTAYGQASIFAANIGNLPAQFAGTVIPLARFTTAHPVLSNGLEVAVTLLSAFGLLWGNWRRWGYVFALAWLGFIWWFGLGLGGILTGLGTDPNTPPVIALLMVPAIAWRKYSKK
jgi:hypothetical protein